MAAAGGFVLDGQPLRVHFGDGNRAPMALLEALNAEFGGDVANAYNAESDVRQLLIPLRRAEDPAPPRGEL